MANDNSIWGNDLAWIKAKVEDISSDVAEIKESLKQMSSDFNHRIRQLELNNAQRKGEELKSNRIYARVIGLATVVAAFMSGLMVLIQMLVK